MQRPMLDRNRVALSSFPPTPAEACVRRPLVAALAGVLLGLWPATALGEPNIDRQSSPSKKIDIVGALVIVGGGGMPDVIRDQFLELAGGKKGRLVVIPTASELADRTRNYKGFKYWQAQGLAWVKMVNTLDPKKANDPEFIKPLTEATAAWLGGGDQTRLANAYHGTAVERELRCLLARGGVIGGTSAGASVMSAIMITGGNPQPRIGTGFGLLPDVVIDQHFHNRKREKRLLSVLAQYPNCLGLGIDEQTAVVVKLHDHKFTVVGKAHVVVCIPPSGEKPANLKIFKSGEVGDLLLLSQSVLARLKPPAESKPAAAKERPAAMP